MYDNHTVRDGWDVQREVQQPAVAARRAAPVVVGLEVDDLISIFNCFLFMCCFAK